MTYSIISATLRPPAAILGKRETLLTHSSYHWGNSVERMVSET